MWPGAIAQVFRDAGRCTDMETICDMEELRRIGAQIGSANRVVHAKAVLSGLCALSLLDRAEPVLDRP
jgi:hypothetical protein